MKKIYYLLLGVMLVSSTTLVSCSDDDDSDISSSSSSFVGRWEYNNTAFVFNSDKTGYSTIDLSDFGLGISKSSFTWVKSDMYLFLDWDGSGNHIKGEMIYLYMLDDGILTIYYEDGERMGIYRKQSGSK